jgi:hypothetical protein
MSCVGVPASVLAVWTRRQVTDTDRLVGTVSPVIQDPLVQSAHANRITTEVLGYVDVQQIANEAIDALAAQGLRPQLVDRLHDLTAPLADAVAGLVHDRVGQLMASPEFTVAWNRAQDGMIIRTWDRSSTQRSSSWSTPDHRGRVDTGGPPDGRSVRRTDAGPRSDGVRHA